MSEIKKCSNLVRGGGVNIFQKCLKFKNVPIWSEGGGGGGQHFSKMSEIQKCPKGGRGGGRVNPNWDIVPNFLF